MNLAEHHLLLGAERRTPGADPSLQGPAHAHAELGMATPYLLKYRHRSQPRRRLQQGTTSLSQTKPRGSGRRRSRGPFLVEGRRRSFSRRYALAPLKPDLAFAPPGATLAELAAVAGLRWAIEECFERAKGGLGLDHCEARSWHGWHRHMSLCMAALAFLSKLSADLRRSAWSKPNETRPSLTAA